MDHFPFRTHTVCARDNKAKPNPASTNNWQNSAANKTVLQQITKHNSVDQSNWKPEIKTIDFSVL